MLIGTPQRVLRPLPKQGLWSTHWSFKHFDGAERQYWFGYSTDNGYSILLWWFLKADTWEKNSGSVNWLIFCPADCPLVAFWLHPQKDSLCLKTVPLKMAGYHKHTIPTGQPIGFSSFSLLSTFRINLEPIHMPLTLVWSCDSPRPLNHWGNSYGPGGTQQLPHVRGCTYSLWHCPSPGRTWTTHPGVHWKMAPPSVQPQVSSPVKPQ